ncbi:MAG: hypothetical protein V4487_04355 [Chlamydiota bacterium]
MTLLSLEWGVLNLQWEIWAAASFLSAAALVLFLFFPREKKEKEEEIKLPKESIEQLREELTKFEREFKSALRGHLKISILFWAHYYKKEKVKTFAEAKREVFFDLKKEFPHLPWMESLLEEIRQELAKYK